MILAGDLGGTNARLALFSPDGKRVIREETIPIRDYARPEDVVRAFLGRKPPRIRAATFGIAGPVIRGRVRTTNLPWVLDERALSRKLGIPRVTLINDLVALGLGALAAPKKKLLRIQGDTLPKKAGATVAVIAAGTGLGECALVWESAHLRAGGGRGGGHFVALGTEGGHTDFAPRDKLETELREFLARRFRDHVSYERVVSGPGIGHLYDFFHQAKKHRETAERAGAIAAAKDRNAKICELGVSGASLPAKRAIELFLRVYGAEAGNLALKSLSTGGVYVAGGIAASLASRFTDEFLPSFVGKGRMRHLLEEIPVAVVLDSKIGLAGAAYHAASQA